MLIEFSIMISLRPLPHHQVLLIPYPLHFKDSNNCNPENHQNLEGGHHL
jgi:hypothetical protein